MRDIEVMRHVDAAANFTLGVNSQWLLQNGAKVRGYAAIGCIQPSLTSPATQLEYEMALCLLCWNHELVTIEIVQEQVERERRLLLPEGA